MQVEHREKVLVIGGGRLGAPFAFALRAAGYEDLFLVERRAQRRRELQPYFPRNAVLESPSAALLASRTLIVLTVRDEQIAPTAEQLAALKVDFSGKVCWHCSGALDARVLHPLAGQGAFCLSVHPIAAFAPRSPDAFSFRGIYFDVCGDRRGLERTRRVLEALGAVAWPVEEAQKPALHLSAVIYSNFLVGLAYMAQRVLQTAQVSEEHFWQPFQPLVESTIQNLNSLAPEEALTGPLVRADLPVLRAHCLWLQAHCPEMLPWYIRWNRFLLSFASLSEAQRSRVHRLLDQFQTAEEQR